MSTPMIHCKQNLNNLLTYLNLPILSNTASIAHLTQDSRNVVANSLFFALAANTKDRNAHIQQALQNKACAIMIDGNFADVNYTDTPIIKVANLKNKLAKITNFFYNWPSHYTKVIGITGTNGKTSCCWFVANILNHLTQECALLGTLGNGLINNLQPTTHTTLDQISLQQQLALWVADNIPYVAMEASSHGIVQQRIAGISFDTIAFTNLTRDHLDYHGTMKAYGAAKARLFTDYSYKTAVVGIDENYANTITKSCSSSAKLLTWSLSNTKAEILADKIITLANGFSLRLQTPWGCNQLNIPLLGKFNLANIITAVAIVANQGFPLAKVCEAVEKIIPPPGRMQVLKFDNHPNIVVDYAHTPDAVANSLQAISQHDCQQIFCVFGCGGERDRGKRQLMLQSAIKFASQIIITADNPRNESLDQIIADMLLNVDAKDASKIKIIKNRKEAIEYAITNSPLDSTVAVLGKGHESYQQLGNKIINFNDCTEIAKICIDILPPLTVNGIVGDS